MMKVTLKLFGGVRDKFGGKEFQYEIPKEARVKDFIATVVEKHGDTVRSVLAPTEQTAPQLRILVNGRDINFMEKLETKLSDGDVLSIFPPVGGG